MFNGKLLIAFLGYVLPYGQMSLWGATVITNLLSAIPVFGQDIVELIKVIECFNLELAIRLVNFICGMFNFYNIDVTVFKHLIIDCVNYSLWQQFYYLIYTAKSLNYEKLIYFSTVIPVCSSTLPTIGTVHVNALKKVKKLRLEKKEYLSIPYQFIAFLVGLIDGDGYIQITRTTKGFINIKIIIGLHLEDISTLEYIKSVLKLGKITINKDKKSPNCKLIINRTDLQEIFFPLLKHHGIFFLTETRKDQFNLATFILENDIKLYDEISSLYNKKNLISNDYKKIKINDCFSRAIETLKPLDYINLPFFKNWLVGFTVAEGYFGIKLNNEAFYQLKQSIHFELLESFKFIFETNRKINTEKNKYNQFSVSSKADIQKVINLFSFSGLHPLIGLKSIHYLNWLNKIKISSRYKNLKLPID